MKKLLILLSVVAVALQSCDKEAAFTNGLDFSNSLPTYVELSSTATRTFKKDSTVNRDTVTTVTFVMRTGLQQNVTVTYDITGAINLPNQTAVIERNKLNVVSTIKIPANIIVAPSTTATFNVTLTKAVTASGTQLTIGQKNTPATQKVTINIIKGGKV